MYARRYVSDINYYKQLNFLIMISIKFKEGTYVSSNLLFIIRVFNAPYHGSVRENREDIRRKCLSQEKDLIKIIQFMIEPLAHQIDFIIFREKFLLLEDFLKINDKGI